uniref:uncharacterized protein LOC124010670 n=1 Tax=Oncorhynchus gorbuscha TaxID=8017 RepID=UPI001EAEA599|nr:uncharacterized protein LOC124010670 [Oncorhynchus gorbuscha]
MHFEVHHIQHVLLLAAAVTSVQVPDPSFSLSNERTSIERTYELTKYLEHQLREIKDTYLSYLGPPFSDPDFSPPRPNSTALSLPSAATRLELWRGLENRARLAQNQRAYSVLLGAVRELARSTLCPYLQSSLLHFSTGLDGLLGSISGLMNTLGYALPPAGIEAQYPRKGTGGDGEATGRRPAPLMSQGLYKTGAEMGAGPRRHPLDDQRGAGTNRGLVRGQKEESTRREMTERKREGPPLLPPPPLSPLLSSSPLLAVRPALNDFSRKVEGFWVLRELQSWLWRSAKDFNRLKKRLRCSVIAQCVLCQLSTLTELEWVSSQDVLWQLHSLSCQYVSSVRDDPWPEASSEDPWPEACGDGPRSGASGDDLRPGSSSEGPCTRAATKAKGYAGGGESTSRTGAAAGRNTNRAKQH